MGARRGFIGRCDGFEGCGGVLDNMRHGMEFRRTGQNIPFGFGRWIVVYVISMAF
jgi:hypothetical protein